MSKINKKSKDFDFAAELLKIGNENKKWVKDNIENIIKVTGVGNPFEAEGLTSYKIAVINVIDLRRFETFFKQYKPNSSDYDFKRNEISFKKKVYETKRIVYRDLGCLKNDLLNEFQDLIDVPNFKGVEIIIYDNQSKIIFETVIYTHRSWLLFAASKEEEESLQPL